ncbi:uncharacterized protein ACR2FA_001770 [Aphomia sociella]
MDVIFLIESEEIFKNVAEEIVNNLYGFKVVSTDAIDIDNIKKAKDELKNTLLSCNYNMANVKEVLQVKNWNNDKLKYLLSLIENRIGQLLYETLLNHNSSHGDTVINFDWYMKLILGTSELKVLRYPLLQLVLMLTNSSEEQKQRVYDIDKNVLKKFINVLEQIDEIK